MKKSVLLIALLALTLNASIALATPSRQEVDGNEYIVQADDWLSKVALKYYGDIFAYPVIVEATNAKAAEDDSFTVIDNPDLIEVGQKLWIPTQAQSKGLIDYLGATLYPPNSPSFNVSYDPSIWEFIEPEYDGSGRKPQLIHRNIPGCSMWLRAGPIDAESVSTVSLAGYEWTIFLVNPQLPMYSMPYEDMAFRFGLFLPEPYSEQVKGPCQQAVEDVLKTFKIVGQ